MTSSLCNALCVLLETYGFKSVWCLTALGPVIITTAPAGLVAAELVFLRQWT